MILGAGTCMGFGGQTTLATARPEMRIWQAHSEPFSSPTFRTLTLLSSTRIGTFQSSIRRENSSSIPGRIFSRTPAPSSPDHPQSTPSMEEMFFRTFTGMQIHRHRRDFLLPLLTKTGSFVLHSVQSRNISLRF